MAVQDVQTIAQLLTAAKSAHRAFEFALGTRDPDWATWYAKHMLEHGLQTTASEQGLSALLTQADSSFRLLTEPTEWVQFIAQALSETI